MAELIPHVGGQKNSCLIEVYTFQVTVRFPCSDNVSRRCSCSGTIGALSSVVLLFLNVRFKVTGAAGSDEEIVAELSQMIEMARKTSD